MCFFESEQEEKEFWLKDDNWNEQIHGDWDYKSEEIKQYLKLVIGKLTTKQLKKLESYQFSDIEEYKP